ncbi:MAG TPA: cytochrome c biogenesis heme-transporting ATPase CcmA [Thiohalobacter sp.]|nr:cytochrome c biogenesis heme-transporting ATPase CcmA [Thiohalobacter sp.]
MSGYDHGRGAANQGPPKAPTDLNQETRSISLQAENLECIRDDRILFSGLSFELSSGEVLLLEGRNGSGKTSLLRILCGIRLPDVGSLRWCGEEIRRLGPEYHEQIAFVGHRDGVKLDLTPLENLAMARALGAAHPDRTPDDALDEVNLTGFEDVPTRILSAGQRRRLALARLLVTRAQLWILDEPFTSLDRYGIDIVESMLDRHLSDGGMLALTSHHAIRAIGAQTHRIDLSA